MTENNRSKNGNSAGTWGLLIGIAISAVLLVVLFSQVDWGLLFAELRRVNMAYLPLWLLAVIGGYWIRAVRWRYLLPKGDKLSLNKLFEASCIGFFATFVFPLRAGEFVRPWVLSRTQPVKFSVGFASVVTERVFDVLTLLFLLGISLPRIDNVNPLLLLAARSLGILAGLIGLVMIFAYLRGNVLLSLVERLLTRILGSRNPKLVEFICREARNFTEGLRSISSFTDLLLVMFWSLALWGTFVAMYQVGLMLFGENPSLWVGTVVCVMVGLAVAVPSAPGFLGTFQLGCHWALTASYGYSQEFSLAYSIVNHTLQTICAVAFGAFFLLTGTVSLREIRARRAEQPA